MAGGLGAAPADRVVLGGARDVLPPYYMASGAQPEQRTDQLMAEGGGAAGDDDAVGVVGGGPADRVVMSGSRDVLPPYFMASEAQPEPRTDQLMAEGGGAAGEDDAAGGVGGGPADGAVLSGSRDVLPPSFMASGAQPEPRTDQLLAEGGGAAGNSWCCGVLSGPSADLGVSSESSAVMGWEGGLGSGDVEGFVGRNHRLATQTQGERCRPNTVQIMRGCVAFCISLTVSKIAVVLLRTRYCNERVSITLSLRVEEAPLLLIDGKYSVPNGHDEFVFRSVASNAVC